MLLGKISTSFSPLQWEALLEEPDFYGLPLLRSYYVTSHSERMWQHDIVDLIVKLREQFLGELPRIYDENGRTMRWQLFSLTISELEQKLTDVVVLDSYENFLTAIMDKRLNYYLSTDQSSLCKLTNFEIQSITTNRNNTLNLFEFECLNELCFITIPCGYFFVGRGPIVRDDLDKKNLVKLTGNQMCYVWIRKLGFSICYNVRINYT
jgi:hypothetical protein